MSKKTVDPNETYEVREVFSLRGGSLPHAGLYALGGGRGLSTRSQ